jgi:hypothetical protein
MKYLVLGRCGMDDIPMKLFDCGPDKTRLAEATAFALALTVEDIQQIAYDVLLVDVSIFCNVSILTFGANGVPVESWVVKDLED